MQGSNGSQPEPIYLQTSDGKCISATREVMHYSPFVGKELLASGKGSSKATPLQLPKQVTPEILKLIVDYIEYHSAPGRSDKERKLYDERFVRSMETKKLCEVTVAADSLEMRQLVDMSSRALARLIEGRSPNEIREAFNLPDDLTEEEKLQPVKNLVDDPRIRLLNRLYAKKRQELQVKKLEDSSSTMQRAQLVDTRSLDDLVSFIEAGPAGGKNSKSKGQQAQQHAAGKEKSKSKNAKQSKIKAASKGAEDGHKPSSSSPTKQHPADSSSSAEQLPAPVSRQAGGELQPEIILAPEFQHIMAEAADDDNGYSEQAYSCAQGTQQQQQQSAGRSSRHRHHRQQQQQQQRPEQRQVPQTSSQGPAQTLFAPREGTSQGIHRESPPSPGSSYCSSPQQGTSPHSQRAHEGTGLGSGSTGSNGGLYPPEHGSHQLLGSRPYRGSRLPALPALEPGDDTDGEPPAGVSVSPGAAVMNLVI